MNQITFAGIKGQVIESSEHGNYLVIKLSNRISICGTFTNIWHWKEEPEYDSGFKSFITYIGFNTDSVKQKYLDLINEMGGVVRDGEDKRSKQRVQGKFRYEMKVRSLSVEHLLDLITVI
ncbi:hypothetical protein [Geminocystis sp. GBBB08]|uniref:hypothetical protein n=1 Tax=Geminocystis sp. GBBB08 TaxID=2604140 RepID=UPI0027E39641|nr:hypothetical protein [Geminocystis sp. GBBB08]MBL1208286.1 hypothetical protein [Geminocystis sp. GBBB08]